FSSFFFFFKQCCHTPRMGRCFNPAKEQRRQWPPKCPCLDQRLAPGKGTEATMASQMPPFGRVSHPKHATAKATGCQTLLLGGHFNPTSALEGETSSQTSHLGLPYFHTQILISKLDFPTLVITLTSSNILQRHQTRFLKLL